MKRLLVFGIILYAFVFSLIPLSSAETFPQNSDVLISHPIRINGAVNSNIDANISIKNPLGNFIILSKGMDFNSSTQEHQFLLDDGNTTQIGNYPYCITATGSGLNQTDCFSFDITPSGFSRITAGEGIIVFGGLLLMFSIGIFSFLLFMRAESPTGKLTFMSVAGIFTLMSILFSTILLQQNLGGFGNILSGYETFVFVVKSVVTVALLAFFIFVFLIMLKAWKLKRGIFD